MTSTIALSLFPPRLRRIALTSFVPALACLLPIAARAQVTFTGGGSSVDLGSQALRSISAPATLPFMISANTTVGSIAVLTTGSAGKDFAKATGSTCTAMIFTANISCTVNVAFKPTAPGMRMGAVVFFSGIGNTGAVLASVPVFGIGTGPQLVFGPGGAQTTVGSNFLSPEAVTIDAAGNAYVADVGLQEVFKVTPAGKETTLGNGLQVPDGVAVDGAGNVYIADSQAAAVFKVTPRGVQTTIGKGFSFPSGIAVDGAGNVYVSDPFIPTVFKVHPNGEQTMVGKSYNTPAGVAVDAAGNVYVADTFNAEIFKITPGGKQTTVGGGFVSPAAVAVDAAGNLYVTDDGTDTLYEVNPEGVQTTVISGLNAPNGVALDGSGNLYVVNSFSQQVMKIDRVDPPSLNFATTKINTISKDSPKTVEVENIGNAALNFSALNYPVDFPEGALNQGCTAATSLFRAGACA